MSWLPMRRKAAEERSLLSEPHAKSQSDFFFYVDILVKYLPSTDKQMNKKISILKDHDFIE